MPTLATAQHSPLDELIADFIDSGDGVRLVQQAAKLPVAIHDGPKSTLTEQIALLILGRIKSAIDSRSLVDTQLLADYAGVKRSTLSTWVERGLANESTPIARAFAYAYTRLMADMVAGQLDQVSVDADAKTRWAMLEGTFPRRFSKNRITQGTQVNVGVQINAAVALRHLQGAIDATVDDAPNDVDDY